MTPPDPLRQTLEAVLELVVERAGDPAPRVYEQLFAADPSLRALFVNDPRGSVRGEMFHRAVEALLDVAGGRPYAHGLIAAECVNHQGMGVTTQQFASLFDAMGVVFRQALGADWTQELDLAWHANLERVYRITTACAGSAGKA